MHYVRGREKKLIRMVKLEHLFVQSKVGYTLTELAGQCGVSEKTISRDIKDLEESIYLPIYTERDKEGKYRFRIEPGSLIPISAINMHEAMCILMALRLTSRYSHHYDPNVASTFQKLNSAAPSPLREQIQNTLNWMIQLPEDRTAEIRNVIARGMVNSQKVKISYNSLWGNSKSTRVIQPYCIEPAAMGHASYVIGYCQKARDVRTFKIERIEKVVILKQKYKIPADFDATRYFSTGWGIVAEGDVKKITLVLQLNLAKLAGEVTWHRSQKLQVRKDGSAMMTVNVVDTPEFYHWVMGWGDRIEVLSPADVRQNVIARANATSAVYSKGKT